MPTPEGTERDRDIDVPSHGTITLEQYHRLRDEEEAKQLFHLRQFPAY